MIAPKSATPRLLSVPITRVETDRIYDFLQGAVYCWCKERGEAWFALRDLMGGRNFYWQFTPLYPLFQRHITNGRSTTKAVEEAGKDAGKLLVHVVDRDKRQFETRRHAMTRQYRWVPHNESND